MGAAATTVSTVPVPLISVCCSAVTVSTVASVTDSATGSAAEAGTARVSTVVFAPFTVVSDRAVTDPIWDAVSAASKIAGLRTSTAATGVLVRYSRGG